MDPSKLTGKAREAWVAGYQEALADVLNAVDEAGRLELADALAWCRNNGTGPVRQHAENLLQLAAGATL